MSVFSTLPPKPLNHHETNRIRARDDVEGLITLEATSSYYRRDERKEKATDIVLLIEETLYALEYEECDWSVKVLQHNANRQDLLERALDRLDEH